MAKPSYSQVKVNPVGHQSGKVRYPQAPGISAWRNNLTALSQYHNLYFVAIEDRIRVFSPNFPHQNIPSEPLLSIKYEASSGRRRGTIDARKPHAANHIIVQDLGHEEILLIGCDDGDIVAYKTYAIQAAIDSRSVDPPKAFFIQNVGLSAWGLAIHKNSRLIAVSSNSSKILVFAFALYDPTCRGEGLELPNEYQDYSSKQFGGSFTSIESPENLRSREKWHSSDPVPKDRRRDIVFGLHEHSNNIPNISFWNSNHSEEDVFLASVDIDGHVCIWNVWRRQMLFTIHLPLASKNERYPGWDILCIDPFDFRRCETERDAYGCDCPPRITLKRYSHVLARENTECVQDVDDNALQHPALAKLPSLSEILNMNGIHPLIPASTSEDAEDDFDEDDEFEVEEDSEGLEVEPTMADTDSEDDISTEAAFEATHVLETDQSTPIDAGNQHTHSPHSLDTPDILARKRSPYEPLPSSRLVPFGHAAHAEDWIPFNLLCTTEREMTLLSDLRHSRNTTSSAGNPNCKALVCQNSLLQTIPPNLHTLCQIERLNMTCQIPELGLALVGNQTGRVALLALTTPVSSSSLETSATPPASSLSQRPNAWSSGASATRRQSHSPYSFSSAPTEPVSNSTTAARREHAFKVEAILPLASQEHDGKRPDTPLLGMAVAPVQQQRLRGGGGGNISSMTTESNQRRHARHPAVAGDARSAREAAVGHGEVEAAGSGSRRWRLIMMYYDHTVLSYEIWRAGQEGSLLII